MSILEDLYYGNVSPCDRDVRRGSKVDELQNLVCQYEEELNGTLTQKQKETLEKFKGKIMQTPPIYSALKKDGVRLYELARQGKTVDIEAREISINSLELLAFEGDTFKIAVDCSKGTYIRSLCRDIGDALGCGATMTELIRTATGGFDIKDAAKRLLEECKDYETSLDCDISMDADKEIKYAFLTILKEALTNVQKHSNATRVKVVLNELEEYYQMMVEDNGTGRVNVYNPAGGIGLRNMEERVRALGGIITFSGEQGFRIFISVPKKKDV